MTQTEEKTDGKGLAIAAESLFLLNLLFPILPLLVLGFLYFRHRNSPRLLVECHVKQTWIMALLSTALFILINLVAYWTGGYQSLDSLVSIHSLVALEAYTLLVILPFAVPGLLGLTKAMSGQCYRYPFLGKFL